MLCPSPSCSQHVGTSAQDVQSASAEQIFVSSSECRCRVHDSVQLGDPGHPYSRGERELDKRVHDPGLNSAAWTLQLHEPPEAIRTPLVVASGKSVYACLCASAEMVEA